MSSLVWNKKIRAMHAGDLRFNPHAGKVLNRKSRWRRFLRDTVPFSFL